VPLYFVVAAGVDRAGGGPREPRPPKGYVVSFAKFHRHGLGAPPSRFMRALCHHYGVEL